MIIVQCRNVALSEIRNLHAIDVYNSLVRPLGYEFALELNAIYAVIGVRTQRGTPWLYATATTGEREVQIVPAALFRFDWQEIPSEWRIRVTNDGDLDMLPSSLSAIENWFERYVEGDSRIVDLVNRELDRGR